MKFIPTTKVVVHNLPSTVSVSDIEDIFSVVGNVVSVQKTTSGKREVEMATREEAENCLLYFQRRAVAGMKLVVSLEKTVS